jgi:hypothetical protein
MVSCSSKRQFAERNQRRAKTNCYVSKIYENTDIRVDRMGSQGMQTEVGKL